jgi:hypothetical protein
MIRTILSFLVAGILLFGVGCAGIDDREEQSEFEKLRKYPVSPQGDRTLPAFEKDPDGEEAQRFAFLIEPPPRSSPRKS